MGARWCACRLRRALVHLREEADGRRRSHGTGPPPGPRRAPRHLAQPVGGLRARRSRRWRGAGRGGHGPARRSPCRGGGAGRGPGGRPGARGGDRLRDPRAVRPPRTHPAVRRRPGRRRRRPGGGRRRGPRPAGGGAGTGDPASGGHLESTWGWAPPRSPGAWRPTSTTGAPADRWSCSSWPPASTVGPQPRTGRAAGSPVPRRGPTPTGSGPRATRSWSVPARCAPTTRR